MPTPPPPERPDRCPACGYDLRGVTTQRCPECGLEPPWQPPPSRTDLPPRALHGRVLVLAGWMLIASAAGLLLIAAAIVLVQALLLREP